MALSAEVVKEYVDAIMATDVFQWIRNKMDVGVPPTPPALTPLANPSAQRSKPSDRQMADEMMDLVHNARAAGQQIDADVARYAIHSFYDGTARKHPYHVPRNPAIYRLEDSTEQLKRDLSAIEHSGHGYDARQRAERVVQRVDAERAKGNYGCSYEEARQLLGIS
jgi:hypothetical protein